MEKNVTLWFKGYDNKYETEDPFFVPVENLGLASELENNYTAIYEELKVLWESNGPEVLVSYRNYSAHEDGQIPPNSWKKLVFMVWGTKNKQVCDKFPLVSSLFENYPAITSCYVTKLSGHSRFIAHNGSTNAQYRVHLGLKVPQDGGDACIMQVGDEKSRWENGKTFAFIDAQYHQGWNDLDGDRYVLIVDILRPEFANRRGFICARVIIQEVYSIVARKIGSKYLFRITNTPLMDIFTYFSYLPLWAFIMLNNRIGLLKL